MISNNDSEACLHRVDSESLPDEQDHSAGKHTCCVQKAASIQASEELNFPCALLLQTGLLQELLGLGLRV